MPHCIKEGPSSAGRDRSLSDIALMHHAQRPCASATSDPRDPRVTSSDVIRQLPMRVKLMPGNMRRALVPEGPTKIAQHEVLGNAKRDVRPARDDRRVPLVNVRSRRSSHPGRFAFLERQPSTTYWATFVKSLRDESLRVCVSLRWMVSALRRIGYTAPPIHNDYDY
jgi:hypothetical protein